MGILSVIMSIALRIFLNEVIFLIVIFNKLMRGAEAAPHAPPLQERERPDLGYSWI